VTERLLDANAVAALGLGRGLPAEDEGVVLAARAADVRDVLDDSDHDLADVELDADGDTDVGDNRDFGDPGTLNPVDGDPDAQQRHEHSVAASQSDGTQRHGSP
jgi:hypothetical protein